jgi:phosphohistidine phosphatase
VRHAQAEAGDPSLNDGDRSLTPQGVQDAQNMAQRLADSGGRVDALFSSPARRAQSTADVFAARFQLAAQNESGLYRAEIGALQQVVRRLDDRHSAVMLVGHNPEFSAFMRYLTDEPYADLPSGGIAVIDLPLMSWRHTVEGKGLLKDSFCPDRAELGFLNLTPMSRADRMRLWRMEHSRMILLSTVFTLAVLLILGVVGLIMHQSVNPAAMPQQGS